MATQYTSILKLALPVQGELSGTWGDVVNDNITSMVEEAIAGRAVINTWTANSHTLTTADGTTSESRAAILTLTDTGTALTGAGTVICPAASKIYIVENGTGQTITVKTSSGTGVAVPNTKNMVVFCDGTNVEEGITNINSLTLNGDGATVSSIKDEDNMASDSATALATQQSIKAYVDSQVATADTLSEVLANGNTTGGTNIAFGDNDKAVFGAGSDLEILSQGTDALIRNGNATAEMRIESDDRIVISDRGFNEAFAVFNDDSDVKLYHDGSQKFATTSTGIDVTGVITTDGMTTSADINFGDNDKAVFGAGSDLQIFHDGSNSFINEAGTGDLTIKASNNLYLMSGSSELYAQFTTDGAATLYHNNAAKLATTSTGIDVTGTVTADGLTVTGTNANLTLGTSGNDITFNRNADNYINASGGTSSNIIINPQNRFVVNTAGAERMRIDSSGRVGIGTSSIGSSTKLQVAGRGLFTDGLPDPADGSPAGVAIGYNTTSGYGFVQAIQTGVANKDLYLQPSGANNVIIANSGGNVGIGTSSPSSELHVKSSDGEVALNLEATTARLKINTNNFISATSSVTTFGVNGTERMRIESDGDVGIGVTSVGTKLDISTEANKAGLRVTAPNTTNQSFGGTISAGTSSSDYAFNVNNAAGADLFRIRGDGNVGIGTSSPSQALHVAGAGSMMLNESTSWSYLRLKSPSANGGYIQFADAEDDDVGQIFYYHGAGGNYMSFTTNASEAMRIDSSGNVGIGTSSPAELFVLNKSSGDTFVRFDKSGTFKGLVGISDSSGSGSGSAVAGDVILRSQTRVLLDTGGTTRAVVDASGNVGIGTSSPDAKIHGVGTQGSGDVPFIFENSATSGVATSSIVFAGNGGGGAEKARIKSAVYGDGYMAFHTNDDSEKMRIDASGTAMFKGGTQDNAIQIWESGSEIARIGPASGALRFLVGSTTTPRMTIDSSGILLVGKTAVSGSTAGVQMKPAGELSVVRDGNHALILNRLSSDGSLALFQQASTTVGSISVTSSATAYNTSSDQRLKDNIVDAPSASADIDAIQVRSFIWKADGSHQKYGMVAQELQSVAPEAVSGDADSDDMMGVDYSKLVPMMMKEIQSLRARVAQLEGEI